MTEQSKLSRKNQAINKSSVAIDKQQQQESQASVMHNMMCW